MGGSAPTFFKAGRSRPTKRATRRRGIGRTRATRPRATISTTANQLLKEGTWDAKRAQDIATQRVFCDKTHFPDDVPAYMDHPLAAIRTPPIPIGARQLVRIRVMFRMMAATPQGAGGFIVRDSFGGEALQYRDTTATGDAWRELVLYRRAPADGDLTITFGLAGFGVVFIDEIRVDRLRSIGPSNGAGSGGDVARRQPPAPAVRTTR